MELEPDLLDEPPLSEHEAGYVRAARAANTLRSYRSDWTHFTTWCTAQEMVSLPAAPATLTAYLSAVAQGGAAVGTLSRRLSLITFAHTTAGHPDPTAHPRVSTV